MAEDNTGPDAAGRQPWQKAIEHFRAELQSNDDYEAIVAVKSLDSLLGDARWLALLSPVMKRLMPMLKLMNSFSITVAHYFSAETQLIATIWGGVWLMLALAGAATLEALQEVVALLEDFIVVLPRYRVHEKLAAVEAVLLDTLEEVVCYFARVIHFFRTRRYVLLRRSGWNELGRDSRRTLQRIKHLSSTVEKTVVLAELQANEARFEALLNQMETSKSGSGRAGASDDKIGKLSECRYLPVVGTPKFWGRDDALRAIEAFLKPESPSHALLSFALFGKGGIGKTEIALQYVRKHLQHYDAVLWVRADDDSSLRQSCLDIVRKLRLADGDDPASGNAAAPVATVRSWLMETRISWLLIVDNADNFAVVQPLWPATGHGAILLTTRDREAAYSLTSAAYHVRPFDSSTASGFLLYLLELDPDDQANKERAHAIVHALGGLPLALNQIGHFIIQRKLPLQDFLPLYERHATRVNSYPVKYTYYEHSLATVWEALLHSISGNACRLLKLLLFFEPDSIPEMILLNGPAQLNDAKLAFLSDPFWLGNAEEDLLKVDLIDKNAENATLSVHRLVQSVAVRRLSEEQQRYYFDAAVGLLCWGSPYTWSDDIGHQFQAWDRCEKSLPHVHHLIELAEKRGIITGNRQMYGELLLRCSWYLYEREEYSAARSMVERARDMFDDSRSLAFASAAELIGLIELDTNRPLNALTAFHLALAIRQTRRGPEKDDPLVASSLNNIGLALTESSGGGGGSGSNISRSGGLSAAEYLQRAMDMRLRLHSARIGNSYSNMASELLRLGQPYEAEAMLLKCPALQGLATENGDNDDDNKIKTDDDDSGEAVPVGDDNPRFAGDMVLLSRIRLRQGRLDEALRWASKALAFRRRVLGDKLKTCDLMYYVADMLIRQGKTAAVIDLLEELRSIAERLDHGEGQAARANYKLAVLYAGKGAQEEGKAYKTRALALRKKAQHEAANKPFEEDEFMKLCPWMLW